MLKVGSTKNINLLVQFDPLGGAEVIRYYIEKGKASVLDVQEHHSGVTSGTTESLYNFIKWGIENFPANHIALDLWNHGSGIKDPSIWGKFLLKHRDALYFFNPETSLLQLNYEIAKSSEFQLKFIEKLNLRGIAFNDSFQTYLTNQDLQQALECAAGNLMSGKKIDVLCMDACHMAMIEVASQVKNAAKYMVGSEEVEPGSGYNYQYVLAPFETGSLSPESFAKHIVDAYHAEYKPSYAEYTQSAFNLDHIAEFEAQFVNLSQSLNLLIEKDTDFWGKFFKKFRTSNLILEFYDTDYIDLCLFLKSLSNILSDKKLTQKIDASAVILVDQIRNNCKLCLECLQKIIIRNVVGVSFKNASGISFYFPKRKLHNSYQKTVFDQTTFWSDFLKNYISVR